MLKSLKINFEQNIFKLKIVKYWVRALATDSCDASARAYRACSWC